MSEAHSLEQLFPGGDFEWAFRMRKADAAGFFAQNDPHGALLDQKRRILSENPSRHLVFTEAALPIMGCLQAQLNQWGALSGGSADLLEIASDIEPDLLLMDQQSLRLVAAAVCFPSSWEPANWSAESIHNIHAVVPRLNPQIGQMITRFLTELKPGKAFQRANWSFTRNAELNYHPALLRQPLDPTIRLDEVFLRIEHQLFTAIEGAVVMGIRIEPVRLISLSTDRRLWQNLIHILETMPEDVARYKSLHQGLKTLIRLMREA